MTMINRLDKLYGMTLQAFSQKLKDETGLTIEDILKINEFELSVLKNRYAHLVYTRDEPNFNIPEIIELQEVIKAKEAKSKRYIEFASQIKPNK